MITDIEIDFPNVVVNNITIIKLSGATYQLWNSETDDPDGYSVFEEIVIEEDMFNGPITGYVTIRDSSYIIEQLNLSTFDSLLFTIDGKKYIFRILNIETPSDFASKEIHGPAGIAPIITLRFTSDEFLYRNFDVQPLANFIGKISKQTNTSAGNEETSSSNSGEEETNAGVSIIEGVPSDLVEIADEQAMKGFVNTLIESMSYWSGKTLLKSDDTFNDIWLKPNPAFYPFSKLANNSRMHQLMNYICEYACLKQQPDRVDFFFWEDLNNWNFRSVFALATDPLNFMGTYVPQENSLQENTIISMEIVGELNIPQLLDTGCLFSEYIRVVPNWGDVYRHNLDSGASLIKRQISYVYDPQLTRPIIANFPPVNTQTLNPLKSKRNPPIPFNTNRLVDNNYGYYSSPYNTKNSPWWNFYNHMSDGFTGDRMKELEQIQTEDDLLDKRFDFGEMSRLESDYWQAQFDFCELPGAILRKIYKEIKWPLAKARREYAKYKQNENALNTFRKSICCERDVPLNFFAILMDAEKIYGATDSDSYERDSGGIYAYEWVEVEMWPKESFNQTEIENILFDKSKKIIEFEDDNFPFLFAVPSYALMGKKSKEYSLSDKVLQILKNKQLIGTTQAAYYTQDNRAYNLNEILNSVVPPDFEDGTQYQTLLMNPGITDLLGSADSEQRSNKTNYPTETIMMPVGKFRIISESCPDFAQSGSNIPASSAETNSGGFYFGGRVVQMNAIPIGILQAFRQFDSSQKKEYLFVFDVNNAHDGLCNSDNCT